MTDRHALPRGTVTFLFTDIEGSTRLLQRLQERFEALIGEHHRAMRKVFEASNGIEIGTEGDAFFAVFTTASDAVTAAAEAQRALAAHNWGDGIELRVRMGMHTGSATLVGDNYGGIDVHRAARIASAAHGGQILLSSATAGLVELSPTSKLTMQDLGRFRLKDLERPEHLHQLCVEGLRSRFPPPRALDPRASNLPPWLTSFVHRGRELRDIAELLGDNRLVTLTGPGGTGKTRLSLAVGEAVMPAFNDGVFVVFLAPLEDPMLVASTVAQTLGLREQGMIPIEDTLEDHLRDKELLLILDNFEQIVPAAPVVADLLASGPRVKVLVTSRTPLRLAGEQEYRVPPMALPDPDRLPSLDSLSGYESVDLFVHRARSAKPDFSLTDDNAHPVAELCRRLDGLPLAIELAAARIRLLSPQEIVERLHTSLSLLTGGARDLPERQQTLRGAIDWSYELLDDAHKIFFRRLGVFPGTFGFQAAEETTDALRDTGLDTLDAIETMVDSSLVRRSETDYGETRFRLLHTIREFALDQLKDAGEEDATRMRHGAWCLRHVEDVAPRFTAAPEGLESMEMEHDNVRAALRWAIDSEDVDAAMRLGSSMWRFWQLRSHLAEGKRWLSEIIALPSEGFSAGRARAVMALGSITYWQNSFEETRRHYVEALEIFRGVDDDEGLQEALYNAGFLSLLERDPGPASDLFSQSRAIAERCSDKKGMAATGWGLAMAAIQAEDWEEARRWGSECGRLYDELGDLFGRGLSLFVFYQIARYTRDLAGARALMLRYIEEADANDLTVPSALELLAEIDLLDGNLERALRLRGAAEAFRDDYGGGSPAPLVDLSDLRAIARATLDEARIEELTKEGAAMAPQEALAYARKELSL
ncbi:MAG: adenylate/guanylate cyclase domain-containing protein [Actinomycetota bacterium]